jgi:quinoprotein glucose dehydrogenase
MSPSRSHRWRSLLPLAALAACSAFAVTTAQSPTDRWWTGYGSGPDNSRYFPSTQITRNNVTGLQVAWTYPFGDAGSSPIVVRGVIYGRGRNGSLVALEAATGKERWVRERMTGMTSRGMSYWESADGRDQRLIFAMDSLLQEIDARTGKSIMSFGTNGVVDLRVGLDGRDPASIGNIQSSIPGEVFGNLVIVGTATGEGYMSPPGDIRAYDVATGKLAWTFHTVPRPGEFGYDTWPKDAWKYIGGVNNWGEMTVDTRSGIVYIRSDRRHTTSTASIASAAICSARQSLRLTREPENAGGISSSRITTCGISIRAPRPN